MYYTYQRIMKKKKKNSIGIVYPKIRLKTVPNSSPSFSGY